MRKLLGLSLVAALSALPLMAMAGEDVAPSEYALVGGENAGANYDPDNTPIATKSRYFVGRPVSAEDRDIVASAAYVNGAYNAAISAANRIAEDLETDYGTKQGVSASIGKATATGNINATLNGTVGGTLTSDTSNLVIGGGTITNTVTPTNGSVKIPTAWSGEAKIAMKWGEAEPSIFPISVTKTAESSANVLTGVSVASSLSGAGVTSGTISHSLSNLTVGGTATQNGVSFNVHSNGYYDSAADNSPEYVPGA